MEHVEIYYDVSSKKMGVSFFTDDITPPIVCFFSETNTSNDYQLLDEDMKPIGKVLSSEPFIQKRLHKLIERINYDKKAVKFLKDRYLDGKNGR